MRCTTIILLMYASAHTTLALAVIIPLMKLPTRRGLVHQLPENVGAQGRHLQTHHRKETGSTDYSNHILSFLSIVLWLSTF